jgi:signal peptidase I
LNKVEDRVASNEGAAPKKKSALRENIEVFIVAALLALFIRTFIVQAFKIPSGSMKETLQIGDHILVNKFIYGVKLPFVMTTIIPVKAPKKGDIVVFKFPEDPKKDFIKRAVAVGGDTIEIINKQVFVNGALQDNPFAEFKEKGIIPPCNELQKSMGFDRCNKDNYGPVTVPENKIFVMGDNRDHSYDSRFWGFVDLKVVKGKAFMIYWSWDSDNTGVRWRRIGNIIR